MKYHSHFSDDSAHNEATTCEYIKKFIHWMYDTNLVINDGVISGTAYGCITQYRCENTLCNLLVLSFKYRLVIDRLINSSEHVRTRIDVISVSDKTYSRQIIYMIDTIEPNN